MVNALLLAVFSDSHGDIDSMETVIRRVSPDLVLHLGDYARDADALRCTFPVLDIRSVRGNCDFGVQAEDRLSFSVEGVPLFLTHGHLYSVKYTLDSLANAACFSGARLALFGHTHQSEYRKMGGVTLFNPGSVRDGGSYGLITISGGTFQCKLAEI